MGSLPEPPIHWSTGALPHRLRCEELQSAERVAGAEAALSVAAAAVKRWEVR